MHVDTNLLFSFILGLLGIIVSVVIWAASTHAARIQSREARLQREALVDVETLTSVRRVYEDAIKQLESEVQRLREEARSFQEKAIALEAELQKFRERMNKDHDTHEAAQTERKLAEEDSMKSDGTPIPET